jgi:PhnB protein
MTYMSEGASKASRFQPNGWPTVIPRMFTPDVAGVVGFLKSVFNADGDMPAGAPAVVRIGDSVIMVSDGGGAREFLPTFLYVYVDNTDRVCQRAVEAGALIIEHPTDMPYGDRRAMLRDPWGNIWQIATHGPAQKASA